MTRPQAEKLARAKWGKRAIIRVEGELSSPEKRAAAMVKLHEAKDRRTAIDKEIAERLSQLDWYVALVAERKQVCKTVSDQSYYVSRYKFTVGYDSGLAFHVEGYGDTWEEAFAKAGIQ